jgi:hypothetical protein
MARLVQLFLCVFLLCVCLSCTRKEDVTTYQDVTVSGNTPPAGNGVTLIQIQTYVNRLYIDLLGRIPLTPELNTNVTVLKANPFSDSARLVVIKKLYNSNDYYKRFFQLSSARLLNATDSGTIADEIALYQSQLAIYKQEGDLFTSNLVQIELQKLVDLQNAYADYEAQKISINGFMSRMINNYFFDQINMGSENFVKASFEGLLSREPTSSELARGVRMVDGQPDQVLLADGTSKGDFIKIITNSEEFNQGIIIEAYSRFMLRKPTSSEIAQGLHLLTKNTNAQDLYSSLLKTKEYAGF